MAATTSPRATSKQSGGHQNHPNSHQNSHQNNNRNAPSSSSSSRNKPSDIRNRHSGHVTQPQAQQLQQYQQQQPKKEIIGNYLLQKKLGVGTFGEVRLAIHIPTGEKNIPQNILSNITENITQNIRQKITLYIL